MSYPTTLDISRDIVDNLSSIYKYGHLSVATTVYQPLVLGGIVQLPTPSNAKQLRVISTDAADNPNGTGARTILIRGLDSTGEIISETVATNGLSASSLTTQSFWRINFLDVIESGTYASPTTGSHVGNLKIEDSGAVQWALIEAEGYPHSRWQSTFFTVPRNKVALIASFMVGTDSNKPADFRAIQRPNADVEVAPFHAMTELLELTGVIDVYSQSLDFAFGPIPPLTDLGFLGRVQSATGALSAGYDLVLETAG